MRSWYTMALGPTNASGDSAKRAEISIHGMIGGWDVDAAQFFQDLKNLGPVDEIRVSIHSQGGVVTEGWAIANGLKNHSAKVVGRVEGLAASMASVIAICCDELEMPKNAYLMIHNVSGFAGGGADDLESYAKTMRMLQGDIEDAYAERTGIDIEDIRTMMTEETWMNGATCVEKGFADRVLESQKAAAVLPDTFENFANVPGAAIAALVTAEAPTPTGDNAPSGADDESVPEAEVVEDAEPAPVEEPVDPDPEEDAADPVDPAVEPDADEPEADPAPVDDDEGGNDPAPGNALTRLLNRVFGERSDASEEMPTVALSAEDHSALLATRDELTRVTGELGTVNAALSTVTAERDALQGEIRDAAELVATHFGVPFEAANDELPAPFDGLVPEDIESLRAELKTLTDPKEKAALARRISRLRNGESADEAQAA